MEYLIDVHDLKVILETIKNPFGTYLVYDFETRRALRLGFRGSGWVQEISLIGSLGPGGILCRYMSAFALHPWPRSPKP